MQLPSAFIQSLSGISGFNEQAFKTVHDDERQVTSVRLNPLKPSLPFAGMTAIPWTREGYYLPQRPSFTFDPLFHAGAYYVQEASSMFLEQALLQTADITKPLKVLDLCAAPGGKSTHLQSLLSKDSILVSNEVIKNRASILKDNIIKWGCDNVVVSHNDPKDFAQLHGYFDVIVVDAPCSGSGMFRKDKAAIDEWSENNVLLCSQRQQRIVADVLPALKEGGVLIYSTCSYSRQEDEDIVKWLCGAFALVSQKLNIDPSWGIVETITGDAYGYRFWPHLLPGEGFFIAAMVKESSQKEIQFPKPKLKPAGKNEKAVIGRWLNGDAFAYMNFGSQYFAWRNTHCQDFELLAQYLKLIYSGIQAGELMRDKMVPAHALAMSMVNAASTPVVDVDEVAAIAYLQRKDISLDAAQKGWHLLQYNGRNLGWANILPNRVNNYYPKELRILKQQP